jgi:AcrR family transcriptional regulator
MPSARRPPARNDELLAASERAFAARGYFGTSTAQVAAAMGVSQPYVIRTFGSKRELFLRTHAHAGAAIVSAFRAAASSSEGAFDPEHIGAAYRALVLSQPASVLVWAHAFSAATAEPAIGLESRRMFDEVYRALRDAGASALEMWDFMGRGMLMNTLLLMEAPRYADEYDFAPIVDLVFGPPFSSARTAVADGHRPE